MFIMSVQFHQNKYFIFIFLKVARVIIEAASHRVRLRGPNTLTFDSTGPSKPVNAISSTIGKKHALKK